MTSDTTPGLHLCSCPHRPHRTVHTHVHNGTVRFVPTRRRATRRSLDEVASGVPRTAEPEPPERPGTGPNGRMSTAVTEPMHETPHLSAALPLRSAHAHSSCYRDR